MKQINFPKLSKEKLLERGKAKHPEVNTLPARGGGSACGVERGPKWIRYDKIRSCE